MTKHKTQQLAAISYASRVLYNLKQASTALDAMQQTRILQENDIVTQDVQNDACLAAEDAIRKYAALAAKELETITGLIVRDFTPRIKNPPFPTKTTSTNTAGA